MPLKETFKGLYFWNVYKEKEDEDEDEEEGEGGGQGKAFS